MSVRDGTGPRSQAGLCRGKRDRGGESGEGGRARERMQDGEQKEEERGGRRADCRETRHGTMGKINR